MELLDQLTAVVAVHFVKLLTQTDEATGLFQIRHPIESIQLHQGHTVHYFTA
jgi:hypothetical protein